MMASLTLLNVNQLRAGDIILSRPRECESMFIALFGMSCFSHAEIVVESTDSIPLTLEATTDNSSSGAIVGLVRERFLRELIYEKRNPQRTEDCDLVFAKDISNYAKFEVMRWCDSQATEFIKFQKSLKDIREAIRLTPYANVEIIARLTYFPAVVILLNKFIGSIPQAYCEGLFCSQLVAKAYQDGGCPLFTSDMPPEKVSPRRLAGLAEGNNSKLRFLPKNELLFVPGAEYALKYDLRPLNKFVKQHSVDTGANLRASEKTLSLVQEILDWAKKRP